MTLKVASFNINGIKARLPRLLEWLEETRPQVACLQEIKTQDEGFPAAEFGKIGYHAIWHGQKGFNGVAILADGVQPVEAHRGLPGDPEDEHARYLEADVFGLRVVCIYLPNGNPQPGPKFDYKLRWMERLRQRMRAIAAVAFGPLVGASDSRQTASGVPAKKAASLTSRQSASEARPSISCCRSSSPGCRSTITRAISRASRVLASAAISTRSTAARSPCAARPSRPWRLRPFLKHPTHSASHLPYRCSCSAHPLHLQVLL